MLCETCVGLTLQVEDMEQQLLILRSRNKTLSVVKTALQDRIKSLQADFDEIMKQLHEADKEASEKSLSDCISDDDATGLPLSV
jgi:hypothetical protein